MRKPKGKLRLQYWTPERVPMRRQDRQAVKRWLASIHPYANKKYGLRRSVLAEGRRTPKGEKPKRIRGTNTAFPTDEATIRRYFAWCNNHKLNPADRPSMCLYWGISEPHKTGSFDMPPIFNKINAATLEAQLGSGQGWLNQGETEKDGQITNRWRVVVEYFADTTEAREKHKYYQADVRYDREGEVISRSPGRFHKQRLDIKLVSGQTSLNSYNSDDPNSRVSVRIEPEISFTPQLTFGFRFQATTTLRSHRDVSLFDAMFTVLSGQLDRSDIPHPYDMSIKMQSYAYRSGKIVVREREREQRRERARWKRKMRRRREREAVND